jgi:uncharacterized protein
MHSLRCFRLVCAQFLRCSRSSRCWGGLLCLLLLASSPLRANLEQGLDAYKRGDFGTALRAFREAAEAGEETAMFSLGFMYLRGEGIEADASQAAHWLRLAAERGIAPAQHSLALLYYEGRGVERNTAVAANYFESAALRGLADAQYNLGVLYSRGDGVAQDWALAQFWHRKAADQGLTESQLALGVMLANGFGVARDYPEAARWYAKAAASGNMRARRLLEDSFLDLAIVSTPDEAPATPVPSQRVPTTTEATVQPHTPAAPASTPPETGVVQVPQQAPLLTASQFQILQARAVEGEADAQAQLARQYLDGVSIPVNLIRAYVWAVRAQRNGFVAAAQLEAEAESRMTRGQREVAITVLGDSGVRQ